MELVVRVFFVAFFAAIVLFKLWYGWREMRHDHTEYERMLRRPDYEKISRLERELGIGPAPDRTDETTHSTEKQER